MIKCVEFLCMWGIYQSIYLSVYLSTLTMSMNLPIFVGQSGTSKSMRGFYIRVKLIKNLTKIDKN